MEHKWMTTGQCTCGKTYIIAQPGPAAAKLARGMAQHAHQDDRGVDVFTCEEGRASVATCSRCGAQVQLPPAAMLDL
jgi:hypothetical protein